MHQIEVYITSKIEHAAKLAALNPEGIHINSRWIEMAQAGRKRQKPVPHWMQENRSDIVTSHFLIHYVEPADHLKGGIGETFYAVGRNKKVWIAGNQLDPSDKNWGVLIKPEGTEIELRIPHKDVMPWGMDTQHIRMVPSLDQAFKEIRAYVRQERILDSNGVEIGAEEIFF